MRRLVHQTRRRMQAGEEHSGKIRIRNILYWRLLLQGCKFRIRRALANQLKIKRGKAQCSKTPCRYRHRIEDLLRLQRRGLNIAMLLVRHSSVLCGIRLCMAKVKKEVAVCRSVILRKPRRKRLNSVLRRFEMQWVLPPSPHHQSGVGTNDDPFSGHKYWSIAFAKALWKLILILNMDVRPKESTTTTSEQKHHLFRF